METFKEQIENGLDRKGLTKKEFIAMLDITEQAYYQMIRNESTTEKRLNQINNILGTKLKKGKITAIYNEENLENNLGNNLEGSVPRSIYDELMNNWKKDKETIKTLLGTIQNLSLGKRKMLLSA